MSGLHGLGSVFYTGFASILWLTSRVTQTTRLDERDTTPARLYIYLNEFTASSAAHFNVKDSAMCCIKEPHDVPSMQTLNGPELLL